MGNHIMCVPDAVHETPTSHALTAKTLRSARPEDLRQQQPGETQTQRIETQRIEIQKTETHWGGEVLPPEDTNWKDFYSVRSVDENGSVIESNCGYYDFSHHKHETDFQNEDLDTQSNRKAALIQLRYLDSSEEDDVEPREYDDYEDDHHDKHRERSHYDDDHHDRHRERSHFDDDHHDRHRERSHYDDDHHDRHRERSHYDEDHHDRHRERSLSGNDIVYKLDDLEQEIETLREENSRLRNNVDEILKKKKKPKTCFCF